MAMSWMGIVVVLGLAILAITLVTLIVVVVATTTHRRRKVNRE